jgi:hypothetical protein
MSNLYSVDMNIETKDLTDGGGIKMKAVAKEVDPRGFKERTGAEAFALIAGVAINGANPKCSYGQLQTYRKIIADLNKAGEGDGVFKANKTTLDIITTSIKNNKGWPNQDEIMGVLDAIIGKINDAKPDASA